MNRLQERRLELGLSQPQISEFLKSFDPRMDVGMVSRFENGVCIPTREIAEALEFLLEYPEFAARKEHYSHGKSGTRLYTIWESMKMRCYNESCSSYPNYGGRGITVCDEWKNSFSAFYDWAVANGYDDGLTIDRIDNDKGYSPDNCRWASSKEQANNKRNNHYVTYDDHTYSISVWSEITGIKASTIIRRLSRGWSAEDALTTPVGGVGDKIHPKWPLQASRTELFDDGELGAVPDAEAAEGQENSPMTAALAAVIPFGRANAISRDALAARLGLSDRQMRKAVEDARNEGLIILCECNGRGYYQSDDMDEIQHQYKQDTNRAMAILKRRGPMRTLLKQAGRCV